MRKGFRTAARGLGPHPPPGQTRGGGVVSAVKFLFQISGVGGLGGVSLRQLNFCHVSLFLLKGVITAIQLQ